MRYIKLFTHTDLDGVSCAVLANLAALQGGDYLEVEYCPAGAAGRVAGEWVDRTPFTPGMDYIVLITDISVDDFSAQKLDAISKRGKNITIQLLDHHELDDKLLRRKWVKADTSEDVCGTSLLYQWLIDKKLLRRTGALDRFVDDVCLYDTWRFDQTETTNAERLNYALYLMDIEPFCAFAVDWFENNHAPLIVSENPTISSVVETEVNRCETYCRHKCGAMRTTEYKGYTVGYVFGEQYISKLGHRMLESNPDIDIAAIIMMPGHVSLRTNREDINLGTEIAKPLGGGGHPKASGHATGSLPEGVARYILGFTNEIEL